jgi:hypothetical protein
MRDGTVKAHVRTIGTSVVISPGEEILMTYIYRTLHSPLFWDKKIRIAILTLATFIALC